MFQNALNRHWTYVYFTYGVFCFHVSFLCFNLLIINAFRGWNITLLCFTFCFNVSFKKHWGRKTKTLWEKNKNTVGAIQKHWGSDNVLPQCFEKWNMKLKMKHETKNETLKSYVLYWISWHFTNQNENVFRHDRWA